MTVDAPPDDAAPDEGWRVYCALAGSFAAASPFSAAVYYTFLVGPARRQIFFASFWSAVWDGLFVGLILSVFVAGPPAVVYRLCRPPGRRLRTRRGWLTLCVGGAVTPFGLLAGERLLVGWGGILLPAMVAGLLAAAAAGPAEAVES